MPKPPVAEGSVRSERDLYDGDRQFATTLARGLDVLRSFSPDAPRLSNKEISLRSGLPKPTVSRLTYTLTRLGYLEFSTSTRRYQLGSAVLSLGYPLLANLEVRQVARVHMREMAERFQGWVSIGVRDRLNMVYVETARASSVITKPDVGQCFPIIASSMGRAYLAGLGQAPRDALINQVRIRTPELWREFGPSVEKSLKEYEDHGFCTRQDDFAPNWQTAAVSMHGLPGGAAAAFNCAIPLHKLRSQQLRKEVGPSLVEMVKHLENLMSRRGMPQG